MLPSDDLIDWMLESTHWWIESFGGFVFFEEHTPLVLPVEEDFPVDVSLQGHALAEDYFVFVQEHAGLNEWSFRLTEETAPNVSDVLRGMPHGMTPGLTLTAEPATVRADRPLPIPYSHAQLDDPEDLVASMARGLSHYLLQSAPTEAPGAAEDEAFLVDLGACLMGFGVFLANSAFRFQQSEEGMMIGWGFSRQGALSQLDVSFALALVATLLEVPDGDLLPHLRPNPKGFYKAARKHLHKKCSRDLARLRATPPTHGPYR